MKEEKKCVLIIDKLIIIDKIINKITKIGGDIFIGLPAYNSWSKHLWILYARGWAQQLAFWITLFTFWTEL